MKKILAVATNSNPVLAKGVRTGLWLSELTHFVAVVRKAGYKVDIASPQGGKIALDEGSVSGKSMKDTANRQFMADEKLKYALEDSMKVSDANPRDYDALYLAGGHGTMWDFRQSADLQNKITEFHSMGKILSGVCHGVAGFIDSRDKNGNIIVKAKNITGFSNLEDALAGTKKYMPFLLETELKKNGAKYRKNILPFTERVEIADNGKLITGQNPASAKAVGREVVKILQIK